MKRRWLVPAAILGGVAMIAGGAFAATSVSTLNAGDSMNVGCSGPSLSWTQSDIRDGVASCAANPTTTTGSASTTPPAALPPSGGCPQFQLAPTSPIAFCDTLNQPNPTPGTRSGQLNGVLWGVSRSTQNVSPPSVLYNWTGSQQNECGTTVAVNAANDVNMCGGVLVESVNDGDASSVLAMYPRQPFDFAGRTGTVEFNVSDDTEGGHAAWPTFLITDQPVPAPGAGQQDQPGLFDNARNSVSVELDGGSAPPSSCWSANIGATANYQPVNVTTNIDGCATIPPETAKGSPTQLNHVEVQVSATGVQVFMADVNNPSSLHLIADASFQVPLTRGLVWLEDAHYAGCKFNDQCDHTFGWSDIAFDGPVLPRDLGFDVPDSNPAGDLGHLIPGDGSSLTLSPSNPVTAANIAAANGALVEFNYYPLNPETFIVSVDGGAPVQVATPPEDNNGSQTLAVPVPVSSLRPGVQSISVKTDDPGGNASANFDLILAGAGGTVNP